jgi:hypothetical protein
MDPRGGVRNDARPTPLRPTRSLDVDRGAFPAALLLESMVLIDVGPMPGMLSSVVPISRALRDNQRISAWVVMRLTSRAQGITERGIFSFEPPQYDMFGPSIPGRHSTPCGNRLQHVRSRNVIDQ